MENREITDLCLNSFNPNHESSAKKSFKHWEIKVF